MKVALVTTWQTACGIAEHSAFLKQAVEAADPTIVIEPITDLHPHELLRHNRLNEQYDLVVLNYHAALHSQWTPQAIEKVQDHFVPVAVIYHDTGVPNSDQCKGICAAADAFVVHEPYDDLEGNGRYWRMGVPGWQYPTEYERSAISWTQGRPILGSIGFPFPWKNYDQLATITKAMGWALLLIAPTATPEQVEGWRVLNPQLKVRTDFVYTTEAISLLAGCDATAFCYTCANTGQSAAILMGIAARKPVFAFESCRQFRALSADPLANKYLRWCTGFAQFQERLPNVITGRVDCGMVALAKQDSWTGLGAKYADLFHELVGG